MALPRVEISIGVTLNVGNYESVRADATFGMDHTGPVNEREIANTYSNVQHAAEQGLQAALDGVEKMLATRRSVPKGEPRRGPTVPRR